MTAPAQTARHGIPVLGPLSTMARIAVVVTVAISLAAIVLDFVLHANETLLFIIAAVAILGLAWIVGLSTERLGAISGPQVGGILNATFGNIAELIIGIFALQAGLIEVVKASITGSIIGNLLFVLGTAMLMGGWGRERQHFNPTAAKAQGSMLLLATIALVVPAIFLFTADGRGTGIA